MNVENLKKNLLEMKKIIFQMKMLKEKFNYSDSEEKKFYMASFNSFAKQLDILNEAVPVILSDISPIKKLTNAEPVSKNLINVSYSPSKLAEKKLVTIKKEDREKFIKELSLADYNLSKVTSSNSSDVFQKPSTLANISSRYFGKIVDKYSTNFSGLKTDLMESNSRFLLTTYLSMAMFISLGVFGISLLLFILVFVVFKNPIVLALPLIFLICSLVGFYIYPSSEKGRIDKKINAELPFATIYLSAIAGSNMEPTKMFKIVSSSPEYKYVGFEMKKVINQVEIYGYDLINSLKNVAKTTPNKKLAELLDGMASNILSGGSLKSFLEKKSENLLLDYKLEIEQYRSVAGTFMDVYISVLIVAPLIFVMVLIIMSITNLGTAGMSPDSIIMLGMGVLVIVNILFLLFLQMKQPSI
jgi:flagellar protein FlaJ